jgi:hypothetical protein
MGNKEKRGAFLQMQCLKKIPDLQDASPEMQVQG